MVVSALIGAGPTVGRVGEFGAFSRLFGGNLVSVSIDLEFVVFFFKKSTTSEYMDHGQHYPKMNTKQKWH